MCTSHSFSSSASICDSSSQWFSSSYSSVVYWNSVLLRLLTKVVIAWRRYMAGHVHYYQRFSGPMWNGSVLSPGYTNPRGTVHVTAGSGGPPGFQSCKGLTSTVCYGDAHPYTYGRLTVHNATDLTWEEVSNGCVSSAPGCTEDHTEQPGDVVDTWHVHQDHHGPFQIPGRQQRPR